MSYMLREVKAGDIEEHYSFDGTTWIHVWRLDRGLLLHLVWELVRGKLSRSKTNA